MAPAAGAAVVKANRGARLVIGAAVRHRHDGAHGVVRGIERGLGTYRVEFADGEDLVPFDAVRVARPRGERPVAKRRRPAHARRRVHR
jgi:hypothetical protein